MTDARIVAFAASSPPSGWLACDGASLLRASEPDLFDALGTTYGAADGTHFNLPDWRDRFALGKAASGTGSALGQSGGALGHQHTYGHAHSVTQPADHAAHGVTQPGAHSSLTHTGFGADDHPAASHSGMTVTAHNVTHSSAHGSHASEGSHNHDQHTEVSARHSGSNGYLSAPTGSHSSAGSHNHDAHSAHNETVNAHSISSQGADHAIAAHTPTQPSAHSLSAHAFTVDAHSAHTGAAALSATVTVAAADPPYLALIFIIAPSTTPFPPGAVVEHGANTAPADHLACDGQSLLRATYPDLFTAIGTTFGAADGTHFNLPDLRGKHVIGAGAGATFASAGGAASHTHAGASHGHTVTQPGAHPDHDVTQPSHAALSHSGAGLGSHSMTHSGFAVATHSVGQSSGHGTHASEGGHTHDSHDFVSTAGAGSDALDGPTTHSSAGSHTHDAHSAHSGADLGPHAETQASAHSPSHSVTQPNDHGAQAHAGAALNPHSAHSGAALTAAASAATDAGEAPYLALRYVIRTTLGGQPIGALYKVGQAIAPGGTVMADGRLLSRATYADLFAEIGDDFGAGDGSTTFAVPDLRGRIPRGANGDLAATGGALDHTHAVSSTHGHSPTQPAAHSAHTPTQPSDHGSLTHAGAGATSHSLTHSGADIDNHSEDQANAHSAHSAAGSHSHNNHQKGAAISETIGSTSTMLVGPTSHTSAGSHDHSGSAHTHSGFGVNAHNVGQANSHSLAHAVDQPNAHSVSAHSGFAVDAHGAHSGFAAVAGGAGATDAANPPYLVVNYVIQATADVFYRDGSVQFTGSGEFTVGAHEIELAEVSLTPPSSPVIFILDTPT